MTIELSLASPFWLDPSSLTSEGEDEDAVINICVSALLRAGYTVQIRDSEGELVSFEDYDWSDRDVP